MKLGALAIVSLLVPFAIACSSSGGEETGEANQTAASAECHNTGTGLGNGSFVIAAAKMGDGTPGATMTYFYGSHWPEHGAVGMGYRTVALFPGKTVDQLKGLVSYDPEVLKVLGDLTTDQLALECSTTAPAAEPAAPPGRSCHETGSGLGNDSFEIANHRWYTGGVGTKIAYTHNGSFTTDMQTSFGLTSTREMYFDGKTVDQLNGLIAYEPQVLKDLNEDLTLDAIGIKCE